MGYFESLAALKFAAAAVVFLVALKWDLLPKTRRAAAIWGVSWTLIVTAEYWIAGNASYLFWYAELEYSLPFHLFINDWYQGGTFSHAFAGGNDFYSMAAVTGQYVSLERTLLDVFPLWIASLLHKGMVYGAGLWGLYLIGRRAAGLERGIAFGIAAIGILATHPYVTTVTWAHGVGYALAPLAVYICVMRYGRRWFYRGVFGIAALQAISSTPSNSVVAVLSAVFFAGLLYGPRRCLATLIPIVIMIAMIILNWHETLFAMAQLAPLTDRVQDHSFAAGSLLEFADLIATSFGLFGNWEMPVFAAAGIAALIYFGGKRWGWIALAIFASIVSGFLAENIPWRDLRLDVFAGYQFRYVFYSAFTIGFIVAFFALAEWGRQRTLPIRWIHAVLAGLMIGNLAWSKAYSVSNWLSLGGLSMVDQFRTAAAESGLRGKPVRSVAVPYRIPENMVAAAGLLAANGSYNLRLQRHALFWNQGIKRVSANTVGLSSLLGPDFDFKCCDSYEISKFANLDYLRIAGVGAIFSKLPLDGSGLKQIGGPTSGRLPARNTEPIRPRLIKYTQEVFDEAPIRVYALPDPLPMAFAARGLTIVPNPGDQEAYLSMIGERALQRIVVAETAPPPGTRAKRTLEVTKFALVKDGIDVSVVAPEGGIVVINLPHTRFWRATQDGKSSELFPVNQIHMAVPVTPGTQQVRLRYDRPLLRQRLFGQNDNR